MPGRKPSTEESKHNIRLEILLTKEEADMLDRARGPHSRSAFLRLLLWMFAKKE